MKYRTGDLSKILNVSSNTIRRYEEMGYLNSNREDQSSYRYFDDSDVAKMVFISKYRKIGFNHEQIAQLFQSGFMDNIALCKDKLEEIDRQIETLSAIRHMLKDDIQLMTRVREQQDELFERDCVGVYYVPYQKNGKLLVDKERINILYDFMYQCPEIEYCYIFRKDNVLRGRLIYEDAIAIKITDADRFHIETEDECIERYERHFSIMKIVKLPIDFTNKNVISEEKARKVLFDDFLEIMKEKGYKLAGDAMAIRIGFSKEDDLEEQYILLGMPVISV